MMPKEKSENKDKKEMITLVMVDLSQLFCASGHHKFLAKNEFFVRFLLMMICDTLKGLSSYKCWKFKENHVSTYFLGFYNL